MNQFNTIIISLVIASLFQISSFHNLTCNKRYVDSERNFGKFLGHNKRHKYAIFRYLNLNRISNVLLNRTKSFSRTFAIDLVN